MGKGLGRQGGDAVWKAEFLVSFHGGVYFCACFCDEEVRVHALEVLGRPGRGSVLGIVALYFYFHMNLGENEAMRDGGMLGL